MKIKLSKTQWEGIGKKAGWMKKAEDNNSENYNRIVKELRRDCIEIINGNIQREPASGIYGYPITKRGLYGSEMDDPKYNSLDEKRMDVFKNEFQKSGEFRGLFYTAWQDLLKFLAKEFPLDKKGLIRYKELIPDVAKNSLDITVNNLLNSME